MSATEEAAAVEPQADVEDECVSRPRPPLAGRPKVMVRPKCDGAGAQDKRRDLKPQKSMAEKEAEYMAARARIFGTNGGTGAGDTTVDSYAGVQLISEGGAGERMPIKAELKAAGAPSLDPDYNRSCIPWNRCSPPRGLPLPGTLLNVGGKPPSGPHLPRKLVSQARMAGRVLEWKGKYGWIQPAEAVDHPKARKHQGKIFVSVIDLVDATRLDPGSACEFYLFEDEAGLGAEECVVVNSSSQLPQAADAAPTSAVEGAQRLAAQAAVPAPIPAVEGAQGLAAQAAVAAPIPAVEGAQSLAGGSQ